MTRLLLVLLLVLACAPRAFAQAIELDRALRAAGVPIVGVSIGKAADKSTWRIDFDASATPQQRTQAAQLVATFDPKDPTIVASVRTGTATALAQSVQIRAFHLWFFRVMNQRDPTPAEVDAALAQFVQAYKDVLSAGGQ